MNATPVVSSDPSSLDTLHHLAIAVEDIASAVDWYTRTFACQVRYQDDTWALLQFANIQVALVIPQQHPP
nr:VOC family protein [Bryobacterales bacterium]